MYDVNVPRSRYQVLTGMSRTMLIQYPVEVEEFFAWVRSLVNFDVFSIPALGCVIGTSAYTKFWSAMATPITIAMIMRLIYRNKLHNAHKDDLDELVLDAVSQKRWELDAKKTAKEKHIHHFHDGKWRKKQVELDDEDHHEAGKSKSVHRLMLKRAVDVANARQLCIGWVRLVSIAIC